MEAYDLGTEGVRVSLSEALLLIRGSRLFLEEMYVDIAILLDLNAIHRLTRQNVS